MSDIERAKAEIKAMLLSFYENHKNFDDRNPKDIKDAVELGNFLDKIYGKQLVNEAILELQEEMQKKFEEARAEFYKRVREMAKK